MLLRNWAVLIQLNMSSLENQKGANHATVKPRPEAHMDMILFEVFLKSMDLIPQWQILQRH